MSNPETRDRLISIIKQHQLENGQTKLPVAVLAERAGITRQAFNRYYGELKDYSTGKLSIARLLIDDDAAVSEILENKDERIERLERELSAAKAAHEAELDAVVKNRISTLMNNDLMAFEADQLTSTLVNQGNHNAYLNKKITELEVKNAKLVVDLASTASRVLPNAVERSDKNFIVFELDLSDANKAYASSKDFDTYEDAKQEEISKAITKIKSLPNPENIEVLLFQDKYISDFDLFCKRAHPKESHTLVVLRFPVYSQEEIKLLLKSLSPISAFSIYVPYSASEAIVSAKRKFSFRDIPPEEIKDADGAKIPQMTWGFDSIRIVKVRQGE